MKNKCLWVKSRRLTSCGLFYLQLFIKFFSWRYNFDLTLPIFSRPYALYFTYFQQPSKVSVWIFIWNEKNLNINKRVFFFFYEKKVTACPHSIDHRKFFAFLSIFIKTSHKNEKIVFIIIIMIWNSFGIVIILESTEFQSRVNRVTFSL